MHYKKHLNYIYCSLKIKKNVIFYIYFYSIVTIIFVISSGRTNWLLIQ